MRMVRPTQVTTLTSQVGTATVAAQITSTIDDRLNALPIDLETGTINLVISADLSNTSGWRVNTVVIDRVPFTGATDGLPVPINAHRVNEQTHAADNVSCYGRFPETNLIAVDPMKSYKVGIWIKSTGRDMRNFFVVLALACVRLFLPWLPAPCCPTPAVCYW